MMSFRYGTDYRRVLADLKAKRDTIHRTIEVVEQLIALGADSPSLGPVSHLPRVRNLIRNDAFAHLGISEAVEQYLRLARIPQRIQAIVDALQLGGVQHQSKQFYNTVWTILNRGRKEGVFEKFGKLWGLADWRKRSR